MAANTVERGPRELTQKELRVYAAIYIVAAGGLFSTVFAILRHSSGADISPETIPSADYKDIGDGLKAIQYTPNRVIVQTVSTQAMDYSQDRVRKLIGKLEADCGFASDLPSYGGESMSFRVSAPNCVDLLVQR